MNTYCGDLTQQYKGDFFFLSPWQQARDVEKIAGEKTEIEETRERGRCSSKA